MSMEDCLNNLLAQFDKLYPRSLKKSTSEERKNDKSETPSGIKKKKSRLRDAKITRKRDFETIPKTLTRFRDRAKILRDQRFSRYRYIPPVI